MEQFTTLIDSRRVFARLRRAGDYTSQHGDAVSRPQRRVSDRPEFWRTITEADWPALQTAATKTLTECNTEYVKLIEAAAALAPLLNDERGLTILRDAASAAPDSSSDLPIEVRGALRAELGLSTAELTAQLRSIRDLADEQPHPGLGDALVANLDAAIAANLGHLATAALAHTVARFNSASTPDSAGSDDAVSVATGELDTAIAALRDALVDHDQPAVSATARALVEIARRLIGVGVTASTLANAQSPATAAVAERRRLDAQIGAADLCRQALLWYTVGLNLLPLTARPDRGGLGAWRSAAKRSLRSKLDQADRRSVSSLVGNPGQRDGDRVEVVGTVVDIVNTPSPNRANKIMSTLTISDHRQRHLSVVKPWIHLDTTGAAPGAAVEVTGVWRAASSEHGGQPALEVETVAWARLAKQSFEDFARNAVRHLYEPVANGVNVRSGWVRGVDGPGNPIRYDVVGEG